MLFYKLLIVILWPCWAVYFLYKALIQGEFSKFFERFGCSRFCFTGNFRCIWIHAASVGEVNSIIAFAKHIEKLNKDVKVLITTITSSGKKIVNDNGFIHQYLPLDLPVFINKFLKFWRPDLAIFVDSEIWPNTIHCLDDKNIPTILLNARLSPKSFNRWKKFPKFFNSVLSKYRLILPQSSSECTKFQYFISDNVVEINNLKYSVSPKVYNYKKPVDKVIFIAASTHNGEESIVVNAHKILKKKFPNLLTILVPRHPERSREITELLHGLNYKVRTLNGDLDSSTEFYLADTFGELDFFYSIADVAFVGGSLVPVGGHNIFEAALQKCAIVHGNYMHNFVDMAEYFAAVSCEVSSEEELVEILSEWIENKEVLEYVKNETFELTRRLNGDIITNVYSLIKKHVQDSGVLV